MPTSSLAKTQKVTRKAKRPKLSGKFGPRCKALAALATKGVVIGTIAQIQLKTGICKLECEFTNGLVALHAEDSGGRQFQRQDIFPGWPNFVARWGHGSLLVESIKATSSKSRIKGKELHQWVVAAWCELFGVPMPSGAGSKGAKKSSKQESQALIEDLRSGLAGVKRFNALLPSERKTVRDLRRLNLEGANLAGINLEGINLQSANLTRAKLPNARLKRANLSHATLAKADLRGAKGGYARFNEADLRGANLANSAFLGGHFANALLVGANLRNVRLYQADLRGADLDGAKLAGAWLDSALHDEKTRWPKGFPLPAGMCWKGKGPNPVRKSK